MRKIIINPGSCNGEESQYLQYLLDNGYDAEIGNKLYTDPDEIEENNLLWEEYCNK